MYDGTLTIDTQLNTDPFNKGVADLVKGLKGLALTATGVILGILGIQSVKAIAVLSAEFTRLYQAAQALGQMYGFTAQETRKLIDDLVKSGVQTDVASRAVINFAKEGLDTNLLPALARGAQNLNALADSGQSSSDVLNGLLAGILTLNGQMLRDRGVVVDMVGAYKQFADQIGKTVGALTVQEQRQAVLIAVTEKLRGVTGLYELSQRTAAGQMSSNSRIMKEFQAVIGGGLQDAFFNLIKSFNDLVKGLTAAFKEGGRLYHVWLALAGVATLLSRAIRGIFETIARWLGVQPAQTTAVTEAATGYGELEEAATSAAEAQGGVGEAVEEAAKKVKGSLAAFDQLNVLQQQEPPTPSSGGGGGGGAGTGLGGGALGGLGTVDLSAIEDPLKKIQESADRLYAKLQILFQPVFDAIDELLVSASPLWETVWDGLIWVWENILVPLGEWVITDALPVFIDLLAAAFELLNTVLIALQPLWAWLWETVLLPIAEWTGGMIISILEGLAEALRGISDWISENQQLFLDMTTTLLAFFAAWKIVEFISHITTLTIKLWLQVTAWLANVTAKLADKATTLAIMALYAGDFLVKIASATAKIWLQVTAWIANQVATLAANAQLLILNVTTGIWTGIAWLATAATTAFGAAVAFLTSPIFLVILAIGLIGVAIYLLIANWKELSTTMYQALWIVGWWIDTYVVKPLKEGFGRALDWVKDKWHTIFEGIKTFVKNIMNNIIGFLNGMINGVEKGINAVVEGANEISAALPGEGLQLSYVNFPNIPKLATGAVIPPNHAFAAILGDQTSGTNIEAPENLIRQIIQEEVGNITADIKISFVGTMSALVRELKPHIDKEQVRVGNSLITGKVR